MYPPSNNSCNYNPILSSLLHNNIPSPVQYEHDLFFQSYYHDQYYLQQQQQVPLIEDLTHHILADSTVSDTNPSNCTNSVKNPHNIDMVTGIQGQEGNEEGTEGRENKGDNVMSSRISIIRGRISRNNNKRSSNKDRHSKINTARGPRDRRMRLSIDAARKFFSLQDLLGFDKASKTVDWLLNKSDSAIKELSEGTQLPHINRQNSCSTATTIGIGAVCASNSISECEVISGTDETSSNDKNKETAKELHLKTLTKESRKKARAWARERTKIKKISQTDKSKAAAHDLNSSGSWRPANKTCEEPGTQQLEQLTFHQENNVDDCNLVVNGNWNPFSILNYQQSAGTSHEVGV
ncbi:unnamed protein product [Withania somnifera]